jgi:hypothetical protein
MAMQMQFGGVSTKNLRPRKNTHSPTWNWPKCGQFLCSVVLQGISAVPEMFDSSEPVPSGLTGEPLDLVESCIEYPTDVKCQQKTGGPGIAIREQLKQLSALSLDEFSPITYTVSNDFDVEYVNTARALQLTFSAKVVSQSRRR